MRRPPVVGLLPAALLLLLIQLLGHLSRPADALLNCNGGPRALGKISRYHLTLNGHCKRICEMAGFLYIGGPKQTSHLGGQLECCCKRHDEIRYIKGRRWF